MSREPDHRGWTSARPKGMIPKSGYTCKDCSRGCPRSERPKDGICGKFSPLTQTIPNVSSRNPEFEYHGRYID